MPEREEMGTPYEKPGPPRGKAYGIAAVTQALEGVDFPAEKSDLMQAAGDKTIEWTKGQQVSLRDALQRIPEGTYPSMAHVVSAMSDVMEGREEAA